MHALEQTRIHLPRQKKREHMKMIHFFLLEAQGPESSVSR